MIGNLFSDRTMMNKRFFSFLFLVTTVMLVFARQSVEIVPQMLTCEDMTAPSVLETRQPRFSWINTPVNERLMGKQQTAYQNY